jgi:hypothetical protein
MSTHIGARFDPDRPNALLGQAVVEFGATVNAALVVICDRLGPTGLWPGPAPPSAYKTEWQVFIQARRGTRTPNPFITRHS